VTEWLGKVTVSDNEQATPHFEVDTPYMAAVVKGTVFTAWTKPGVSSGVSVTRGRVEVHDPNAGLHVNVLPGQQASVGSQQPLTLAGSGTLQPILNNSGQPVSAANGDSTEVASAPAGGRANAGSSTKGEGKGGNHTKGGDGHPGKHDNGAGKGGGPGNGGQNPHAGGNGNSGGNDSSGGHGHGPKG
jgi:hypothetical protein